jgi:predicted ester cyclase
MGNIKEIVERGGELFNSRAIDQLLDLYAPQAQLESSGGMSAKGREEIRKFTESWVQGFPDCRIRRERLIVEGSTVVEVGVFSGTHTGTFPTPMGDLPPTGRHVEGPYVDIFDFENDKIVRDRLYLDRMDLMEQLGMVPTPTAAGATA